MSTKSVRVSRSTTTIAASAAMGLAGIVFLASGLPAQAAPKQDAKKVWVCKYVGKPGVDERLKPGKNPINVAWQSTNGEGPTIGATFNDAQGLSVVVAIGGKDALPAGFTCPTTSKPTTPTTPPKPTKTTKPPKPTKTTTPPKPTKTTKPTPTKTTKPSTTPAGTPTTQPPAGGAGGGTTPGVGAPATGGAGEGSPINGLIGSGLLLGAAGLLTRETVKRRNAARTQD